MAVDTAGIDRMPEDARRELLLKLLDQAGAVSVRVNDSNGEIIHGCLLTPGAHDDQVASPTASINYRTLAGSCFGCGAKGGLRWFVGTVLHTDDAGARQWLAAHGVAEGGTMATSALLAAVSSAYASRKAVTRPEPIPTYHHSALAPFAHPHPYWTDPLAPPGLEGGGRGIDPATVAAYHLGYDPATDRVVIPHWWRGQLVGWQKRPAGPVPDGVPKYQNSPSFPRSATLFHLRENVEELMLVESVMSVLKHAHAMNDIAASFGAWLNHDQIAAIVRLPRLRRVIVWPDNDRKGWDAFDGGRNPRDSLIMRLSRYVPVFYVASPFGGDPADLDTSVAVAMREQWTQPAMLWKRPEHLFCWSCRRHEHPGPCSPQQVAA